MSLPLGVCVLTRPPENKAQPVNYADHIFEILAHAGLCYVRMEPDKLIDELPNLRLLVTVGEQEFDPALKQKLAEWVRAGNGWLSLGGVCGMSDVLGVD